MLKLWSKQNFHKLIGKSKNFSTYPNLLKNSKEQNDEKSKERNDLIVVEKDMNITLIGINRENCRNSIDIQTAQQLTEAIKVFEADEDSPVGVLYGVGGGSFCAGYDLCDLENQMNDGTLDFLIRSEGAVGPTRRQLKKPLIAAINGYCVANGLELALMCDLRVMEDSAILGFFNRNLGLPLTDGGTVRLTALVGLSRAVDIISTGRPISATEAFNIGLINRIVATGTALGQAVHLAFCISKFMQDSLLQDRQKLLENTFTRDGLRAATQREVLNISEEMLKQMHKSIKEFKGSKSKSNRTDGWSIREKQFDEWEKIEIAFEEKVLKDR